MKVDDAPYSTQYGGFSGGLTTIETKPPADLWHFGLMDFTPGVRAKNGHIVGLSDAIPRLFFGGPLIAKKVTFSEDLTYDENKKSCPWAWSGRMTKPCVEDSTL
jgi:hypothetical protein